MATLSSIIKAKLIGKPAHSQLLLDGRPLSVKLRYNKQAKRIILRMDKDGNGIVLTIPNGTPHQKAMEFAASQGAWIWQQIAKQPQRIPFKVGQTVLIRDEPHLIVFNDTRRTPVWTETVGNNGVENQNDIVGQKRLMVSGDEKHHARRIKDWLIKQARKDLTCSAFEYAQKMGGKVNRISIRDTASRWGSCSSNGSLSFSWRLILAPEIVLDYVAAHEAAHLIEMNHSPRFWQLVDDHCPHANKAKKWLKANGRTLHKYGHEQK